ncbi:MAG: tRNA uridine-5-carboxymethylaminomethyl(34) synthesis GTPase MnmE [Planctomycetaceae bacterium]|nr:tRNA uridine-5-carboxymethylaminomethyl(34) synthesis GTPase MnmE [Planctomycetaceae bacterium]
MHFDLDDTIVAAASAAGGAARAVVRVSGPQAARVLSGAFHASGESARLPKGGAPCVVAGSVHVDAAAGAAVAVPADLFWWPTERSYTRQPVGELHLPGSPPLVQAVVDALCAAGARPARPGEFTLRAFLAGRLDLTQAEAVLGVIDARGDAALDTALAQLAGGLSRPLQQLRDELLDLLAELEAGLDFADEDIEFISAEQLTRRLTAAQAAIEATRTQLHVRGQAADCPRAVLLGPPNAGKSSLFNALAQQLAIEPAHAPAIVSEAAGTTRDYLVVRLDLHGVLVDLVDTAGEDAAAAAGIEADAQRTTDAMRRAAEVQLHCIDAAKIPPPSQRGAGGGSAGIASFSAPHTSQLQLLTKTDLLAPAELAALQTKHPAAVPVSSTTAAGLDELIAALRAAVEELHAEAGGASVAATAVRAADSLRRADAALTDAAALAAQSGAEDLVAAEVRAAVSAVGEVVGAVYVDDVLDRIFGQFCIGK